MKKIFFILSILSLFCFTTNAQSTFPTINITAFATGQYEKCDGFVLNISGYPDTAVYYNLYAKGEGGSYYQLITPGPTLIGAGGKLWQSSHPAYTWNTTYTAYIYFYDKNKRLMCSTQSFTFTTCYYPDCGTAVIQTGTRSGSNTEYTIDWLYGVAYSAMTNVFKVLVKDNTLGSLPVTYDNIIGFNKTFPIIADHKYSVWVISKCGTVEGVKSPEWTITPPTVTPAPEPAPVIKKKGRK